MSKEVAEYVLWHQAAPAAMSISREQYLIREVLRLKDVPDEPEDLIIYAANSTFTLVEGRALNRWNAARADLIAAWVDPPDDVIDPIPVQLEPTGIKPVSYWLLSYVLGYSDEVIEMCKNDKFGNGPEFESTPLIRDSAKVLKDLITIDEALTTYHRARYRLIRDYLDAYFHAPI